MGNKNTRDSTVWSFCFDLGDSLTIAVLENILLAIEFYDTQLCDDEIDCPNGSINNNWLSF